MSAWAHFADHHASTDMLASTLALYQPDQACAGFSRIACSYGCEGHNAQDVAFSCQKLHHTASAQVYWKSLVISLFDIFVTGKFFPSIYIAYGGWAMPIDFPAPTYKHHNILGPMFCTDDFR